MFHSKKLLLIAIGLIIIFVLLNKNCVEHKYDTIFSIQNFNNYDYYLYNNDSSFVEKRFLINCNIKDLVVLKDSFVNWSEIHSPKLSVDDQKKLVHYNFYKKNKKNGIDQFYEEDGGLFSDTFGDDDNPIFAKIEWKIYPSDNNIRRLIYIFKNRRRIELSKEYISINN